MRKNANTIMLGLLSLPAAVSVWSGWVGLGGMAGFGVVHPLPGTPWADFALDTSITLPIGVEAYGAMALRVWLTRPKGAPGRRFAAVSAVGSLIVGAGGQIAYHLMQALGVTAAPWWLVALVATLPVVVLGFGTGLAHLTSAHAEPAPAPVAAPEPEVVFAEVEPEPEPVVYAVADDVEVEAEVVDLPVRTNRERVWDLKRRFPDLTAAAISRQVGISRQQASTYVRELLNQNDDAATA